MKKLLITTLITVTTIFAFAQENPLNGKWTLTQATALNKGPNYTNGVPASVQLIFASNQVLIEIGTLTQTGDVVITRDTLALNGKPSTRITPSKRKRTAWVKWDAAQRTLTETSELTITEDVNVVDYRNVEIFNLSSDGELVVERKFIPAKTPQTGWAMKAEYKRQ